MQFVRLAGSKKIFIRRNIFKQQPTIPCKIVMDGKMRRSLSILMGVIIALADLYWISLAYGGYTITVPVALGIIILLADLFWIYFDL